MCKLAREKNQKYQKKKFQAILNADKVNFRGHQKALMRIMDGTTKRGNNYQEPKPVIAAMDNPVAELRD